LLLTFYVEFIYKAEDRFGSNWTQSSSKKFIETFNRTLAHFNFQYVLTPLGFIPKTEQKLVEEVYEPVIVALNNPKWKEVNDNLKNAFISYRKGTPLDYSTTVELAITAVEAYLQLLMEGKTGEVNFTNYLKKLKERIK
jgi:hypothetical protein